MKHPSSGHLARKLLSCSLLAIALVLAAPEAAIALKPGVRWWKTGPHESFLAARSFPSLFVPGRKPISSLRAARGPGSVTSSTSRSQPFSAPSPSSESELFGDACDLPSDCWTAGFFVDGAGAKLGQALHFDGTTWSSAALVEPGGSGPQGYDYLDAVACNSSSDCWIVGYYGNKHMASLNEALHWTGTAWDRVATPQPAGTGSQADQNQLNGVTCTSSSNCWAVGSHTNRAGAYTNEVLHWNGTSWRGVASPNPNGTASGDQNVLYSASCVTPSECLSVGYGRNSAGAYVNEALLWNGTEWTKLSIPQPGGTKARRYGYLAGVACPSSSGCLAVGGYRDSAGAYLNELLEWDGTTWTQVTLPDPGGTGSGNINQLTALSCISETDCWGVGYYYNSVGAQLDEALEWDGQSWSSVTTPQPGGTTMNNLGNTLYGVSCSDSSDCLAVGYTFNTAGGAHNQALLWDGASWSVG